MFVHGEAPQAFGAKMAPWVIKEWASRDDQTQVICQAEIFPTLVARHTWAKKIMGRRVIFFIDNDSARPALMKQYSPILSSLQIVEQCTAWDCAEGCTSWYARVPTEANLADGPSRNDVALLLQLGFVEVPFRFPAFTGRLASWLECPEQVCRLTV